jgi:ferredoxin-NADP reductase
MSTEQQSWFTKELEELNACPLVLPTVHVTRSQVSTALQPITDKLFDDEGLQRPADFEKQSLPKSNIVMVVDEEKGDATKEAAAHSSSLSSSSDSTWPVLLGRPDTAAKIQEIINNTEESDSTIVAGCGPEGLMLDIRQAVADIVGTGKRSVRLHCEQFGW